MRPRKRRARLLPMQTERRIPRLSAANTSSKKSRSAECHTPRNESGELRQDAWLAGAPIWIRPVAPISDWADNAPALAGLPSFTEEQAERVLEKGTGPEGEEVHPPMHIYHMKREDAKAIIAYLRSLPRSSQTY